MVLLLFLIIIVFLYSCPGFKSPVRERMLYSSCKQPLTDALSQDLNIEISKKVLRRKGIIINTHNYVYQ